MKVKTKMQNSQLNVKVKVPRKCKVEKGYINILNQSGVTGLLKPESKKWGYVRYRGPIGITLNQYLNKGVSKYEFFCLMAQLLEISNKLNKMQMTHDNLVLDARYIYINVNTKEIQFIYLPSKKSYFQNNILAFMETLVQISNFSENNTDFAAKYVQFIRSLPNFNETQIKKYLAQQDPDIANQLKRKATEGSGFITNKRSEYYVHYENSSQDEEMTGLLEDEEATGLLSDEEVTGLLEDEEATGLLMETVYPTLYRTSTGENILIDKPVFRLGKERSYVDYFVMNNSAISRSHADIVTRDNRYFVIDQNSKNGTYVNDVAIEPKIEIEIFCQDCVKLADEVFVFQKE